MSFTNNKNGKAYAPGFFLAHEECVRETRQMAQNNYSVITEGETKHAPMGVAYPSNDSNAIGITYEDVDVTTGDMPASIVTKGIVYENRLAITGTSYDAVTPVTGDNPAEKGWYERSGSAGSYVYTLTTDTTVAEGKTYYAKSDVRIASAAKTALIALGFKFVTEDSVVRPY